MSKKLELGGGGNPRGDGFLNVDFVPGPGVDVVCDLERERLPFADDVFEEAFSAHCLEHVRFCSHALHELVRVCRVGAKVEIRVPHYLSAMALCPGHIHVISPTVVSHWEQYHRTWFVGCKKRLRLLRREDMPVADLSEARLAFPRFTDAQLMRFVPDCAHEHRYFFEVIVNESYCVVAEPNPLPSPPVSPEPEPEPQGMKLELGGGDRPKGGGFVNFDMLPCADVVCDLDEPLPLPDESVGQVFSSHCLEHLPRPLFTLHEIVRVCRVGATVEIRVPHWLSQIAMVPGTLSFPGHRFVISPVEIVNWCEHFAQETWQGQARRLRLDRTDVDRSADWDEIRGLYPHWREDQVERFAPGACYSIGFFFTVIGND